jgi:hypothetical protein
MATRTLFVSEQYMRDNLPLSRNLDSKDLMPNVQMAEELFIQDILGSEFYSYLYSAFTSQTLTSDEVILVQDYIKPAEAYRGLALGLPFLQYQIKNKGAQAQSDDFSTNAGFNELKFLISNAENRAEFYEQRLNKYLCKYSSLFPEYKTNNDGIIPPNQNNKWDSGLLFY